MSFDPKQPYNDLPLLPPPGELETKPVLKRCVAAIPITCRNRRGLSTRSGNLSKPSTYRRDVSMNPGSLDMFPKQVPGVDMFTAGPLEAMQGRAAEGLQFTLERVWTRVQKFSAGATRTKLVLRPKQEQLLQLLRDHKSMTPQEIWDALGVTRQGAMKLMQPLLEAGLVQRVTSKSSRVDVTATGDIVVARVIVKADTI